MTLIERQNILVAELEPIHAARIKTGRPGWPQHLIGRKAKAKHLHIEQMIAAGYTQREASESAQQCDDVAGLNAMSDTTTGPASWPFPTTLLTAPIGRVPAADFEDAPF